MSLIIATGSNLGNKQAHLIKAKFELTKHFQLVAESQIYHSPAVDYENQPDFYNQVLEFVTPKISPKQVIELTLDIETKLGRTREILRGPRTVDIDILFYDDLEITSELLTIPHPRLWDRSFVVLPLSELPYYKVLQKKYQFNSKFNSPAKPI